MSRRRTPESIRLLPPSFLLLDPAHRCLSVEERKSPSPEPSHCIYHQMQCQIKRAPFSGERIPDQASLALGTSSGSLEAPTCLVRKTQFGEQRSLVGPASLTRPCYRSNSRASAPPQPRTTTMGFVEVGAPRLRRNRFPSGEASYWRPPDSSRLARNSTTGALAEKDAPRVTPAARRRLPGSMK